MSRYLAIDVEQGQVYAASAGVKGSAVTLEKAFALSDAGPLTAATAAAIGTRLKESLRQSGVGPAPVLVSVGRERVILKEVKYPAGVGPAEEPALIKFQVSKELAEGGDAVVIDYFALPTPDADGQRRALAFAIRKDVLEPIKALCAAAGLKPAGVAPRPFGIAAALMRAIKDGAVAPPDSPTAPVAILVRGDKWGELVILRGGHVAFTRSLTGVALGSEQAMLGEIKRNLAVFGSSSPQNAVQALFVAEGDLPGGWSGRLRAGLTIPVQSFDPAAGAGTDVPPESRGAFAGPVGLIALRGRSSELPINFLAPREPKPVVDLGKRRLRLVGLAAALFVITGLAAGWLYASQKGRQVAALRSQKIDLEEDIKKLDDSVKRVKAVKDWEAKSVNWLDELYDLTARFPDPAETEVVQLIGKPMEAAKNSQKKHVAALELQINAASNGNSVDNLGGAMAGDPHYKVLGKKSKGPSNTSASSSRKNQQFVLNVEIERREPNKYTQRFVPQAAKAGDPPPAEPPKQVGTTGGDGAFGGVQ